MSPWATQEFLWDGESFKGPKCNTVGTGIDEGAEIKDIYG